MHAGLFSNIFSVDVDKISCHGIIRANKAGIAQLVEHDLAKVGVASSNLVSRSKFKKHQLDDSWCFFMSVRKPIAECFLSLFSVFLFWP